MTKKCFEVFCREVVFYNVRVRAESKEEARRMVESGEVGVGEAEDSDGFRVEDVIEITPQGFPVK